MAQASPVKVAVIGAGIAGAACAHALQQAGYGVHVFDKSRGPGGRMATRRLEWLDSQAQKWTTALDHGALCLSAHTAPFQAFVDRAVQQGRLVAWRPRMAAGGLSVGASHAVYVPTPDMPALCRDLLAGVSLVCPWAVDRLHRGPQGWQLESCGVRFDADFDAVVLALPLPQAARLISPHRADWAQVAGSAVMRPCWTLMGVASAPACASPEDWDLARPAAGPLAWVMRSDARPGRAQVPGQAHWVAHARTGWSRRHLDHSPAEVQQHLQDALAAVLGGPLGWLHCVVHRWLYASPQGLSRPGVELCWWDDSLALGVCADTLGGRGPGVEAAWMSAQAVCEALQGAAASGQALSFSAA